MFDAPAWAARLRGADCPVCGASGARERTWLADLPSGRVLLQDDADFAGYCILYHRRHVAEVFDLRVAERAAFIEDVSRLAAAVAACCRPGKINYANLGNEEPHLHCHVVPRYPTDGWWGQAFSLRPAAQRKPLSPAEYARLQRALRAALTGA